VSEVSITALRSIGVVTLDGDNKGDRLLGPSLKSRSTAAVRILTYGRSDDDVIMLHHLQIVPTLRQDERGTTAAAGCLTLWLSEQTCAQPKLRAAHAILQCQHR
jgi:hypothetical protein